MNRREFLQRTGALVVAFSLSRTVAQQGGGDDALGSLKKTPLLDAWIRVDAKGITVFTGKAELGQGIKTALLQVAAEELDVAFESLQLVTADTAQTADEGFTAGSRSMEDSAVAIRLAAAQVRALLVAEAGRRWNAPPNALRVANGIVIGDGKRESYTQLAARLDLHVESQPNVKPKDPGSYRVVGRAQPRVDIPAKVTGGVAYVQDLRIPGMLHARVVRPPSYGAKLVSVDPKKTLAIPGVAAVHGDANFLAVIADREWTAVKAMRVLAADTQWEEPPTLPRQEEISRWLLSQRSEDVTVAQKDGAASAGARTLEATYTRPYQIHGSIGPSCAVAQSVDGMLTVWTHTQGVYPDRKAIAEMLSLPIEKVRCIHAEGSGCYGHNGADDAAADAAFLATILPGHPIRVQWMREHEHAWEPFGAAMVSKARASLDANGRIVDWRYDVWSNTHSTRPGPAGTLLAARHSTKAFKMPPQKAPRSPEGQGDRNAVPLYAIPRLAVIHHFVPEMPLRVSALRSLGAYHNVFSLESFMDELAQAAGADPVDFRLKHLEDSRGKDVIRLAAERFGWKAGARAPRGRGYGMAFARYKNHAAYCAVFAEVSVDRETGRIRLLRAVAGVDSGQVVNPDGLRNQIEGAIVQSTSWTLHERVSFDQTRIRSTDWATYPILRFESVPESVDVHLIDRPGAPFLGSGECGQGPTAAAIANAVANASGQRLRDLPLSLRRADGS